MRTLGPKKHKILDEISDAFEVINSEISLLVELRRMVMTGEISVKEYKEKHREFVNNIIDLNPELIQND